MNPHTELNSELLSADARGKKHIPFAVFAVILIHVILFVVLLIAAGCRSSARAKANRPQPLPQANPAEQYMQAASNAVPAAPLASATEQVIATEPVIAGEPQLAKAAAATHQPSRGLPAVPSPGSAQPRAARNPAPKTGTKASVPNAAVYVVQSGDTVEKIAKAHGTTIQMIMAANKLKGHMIYPGQKLVVKPASAGSTAQVKKANPSNEV